MGYGRVESRRKLAIEEESVTLPFYARRIQNCRIVLIINRPRNFTEPG